MTAVIGALVGALVAGGVWLLVRGFVGVTPDLDAFVSELNVARPKRRSAGRWDWLVGYDDELAVLLELVGWSVERWRSTRLTFMAAVGGFCVVLVVLGGVLGVGSPVLVLPAVVLGAGFGWWVALPHLRELAGEVRVEASATVAVFLTLVQALMAAGIGPNGAMTSAALAGNGRVFELMRRAMSDAQAANTEPWVGLGAMGERLGIGELSALAATLRQATDGAEIGESLRARADSIREADRLRRRGEMERRAESMGLPLVAMALGFLLLIGYPAVALVLGS